MKTEDVGVESLKPNPRNSRVHSRKQIRQIAKSIEKFGFVNPILTDDSYQIIAGHGRYEAAKQLGMEMVPAIRLSHLSPAEVRAYVIADNRLAEKAGWDREMLRTELQGLIALDFDIEITGFEAPEIDFMLEEARDASDESGPEDSIPTRADGPAVSGLGDVWVLGKHRLVCADARQQRSYDVLLQGHKAAFVIADAPYNVRIANFVSGNGRIVHGEFKMASGEMSEDEFVAFLKDTFERLKENTTEGSIHMVFMDWRHQLEMMLAGRQVYSELKNVCIWNKSMGGMGSLYRSKHEFVYVWKSGEGEHRNNIELGKHGRNRTNVWDYAGVTAHTAQNREELALHPTVKPVALVADAIKDVTVANDLVLDPFCGSGTILIAAERTGRRARAIELDAHYVDVAVRRWEAYTGKKAVHEGRGISFEECEEAARGPVDVS
jgi:DNA modification methylase